MSSRLPDDLAPILQQLQEREQAALESGGDLAVATEIDPVERAGNLADRVRKLSAAYGETTDHVDRLTRDIETQGREVIEALQNGDADFLRDKQRIQLLEVLVIVDGTRPVMFIRNGLPDLETYPDVPGIWRDKLVISSGQLGDPISCVGRVDLGPSPKGTGFLVAPNVILTNRHVLRAISSFSEGNGAWTLHPNATIDFGAEYQASSSPSKKRVMKRVLFAGSRQPIPAPDHRLLDLAAIELEPLAAGPGNFLPINTDTTVLSPQKDMYLIGFPRQPTIDDEYDYGTAVNDIFRNTGNCKQLAPGRVIVPRQDFDGRMAHDASSISGNSGSLIVGIGTEFAASAIHYGGTLAMPHENWGHVLADALDKRGTFGNYTLREVLEANGAEIS